MSLFRRVFFAVSAISLSACGAEGGVSSTEAEQASESEQADSLASTSTYFSVHGDTRRCAAPMCGGYWVSRVNRATTRCADGSYQSECYVVDFDVENGLGLSAEEAETFRGNARQGRAVLRGAVKPATYGSRSLGFFVPTEGWTSESPVAKTGSFYKVTDRGLRCKGDPCFWMHEAKLNSSSDREISSLDFSKMPNGSEVSDAAYAAVTEGGLLAVGSLESYKGPLGRGLRIAVQQFYTRVVHKTCSYSDAAPTLQDLAGREFIAKADAALGTRAQYERHYAFSTDGSEVTISDYVAPCPEGATCFWSGIVTQSASAKPNGNKLELRFSNDTTNGFGLTYLKEVSWQTGVGCAVTARILEVYQDGSNITRAFNPEK